ncbi:MAG: DUF86 domain-containing protein [Thermosynechococcaceae cyanobacterium]
MRQDEASLVDIIQAAKRVIKFSESLNRKELKQNEEKQSAILYQIMIIGEAVKRLSSDFRMQHASIPWRQMAGMRDILTHQYDEVDLDTIWEVIQTDIPQIIEIVQPLLSDV